MAARALLWAVFFAFLSGQVHADNGPALPSNKASVVLPLLKRLPKEGPPRSVHIEINKILGNGVPRGVVGGTPDFSWQDLYWNLDDKTEIHEAVVGPTITLSARLPNGKVITLYPSPKS